jgi:hypothetical protein
MTEHMVPGQADKRGGDYGYSIRLLKSPTVSVLHHSLERAHSIDCTLGQL